SWLARATTMCDGAGVRARILVAQGAIARCGEDFVVAHDQRADGNFARRSRGARFAERDLHPTVVIGPRHGRKVPLRHQPGSPLDSLVVRVETWGSTSPSSVPMGSDPISRIRNGV